MSLRGSGEIEERSSSQAGRERKKERRKNGPLSFAGVKVKATLEKSRHGVKSEMLSRLIFCEKRRSDSTSTLKKTGEREMIRKQAY